MTSKASSSHDKAELRKKLWRLNVVTRSIKCQFQMGVCLEALVTKPFDPAQLQGI